MKDWRINYKRDYLESIINRKRYERVFITISSWTKMKEAKLSRLDATNALINEVREGKQL